ncbi:MAG: FHA domain-containing protein [Solirubrobacteraceae bacterium]|jgi:pSer/pThr/pTyr-binding forkhead associated (FHA) protein
MDPASPVAPYRATAVELKAQLEAAALDIPFLVLRDGENAQRIVHLGEDRERLTVGRRETCDVSLQWDPQVSRVHAELERIGDEWTVSDDGLSSNGTFVNGVQVRGRRRLHDRDELRVGTTVIVFCSPVSGTSRTTFVPEQLRSVPRLGDTQRAVLVALARPCKGSSRFATPASNKQVAAEVVMTVNGVKSIMRALFSKFGIEDLPRNEKRARLVERAFELGAISEDEL